MLQTVFSYTLYTSHSYSNKWLCYHAGHEHTRDRTHVFPQRMEISIVLYCILASLSALGILTAIAFLFFIIIQHCSRR